ncbi:glycosyltransferase [Yersinia alsatica]|uniref:glycosyltransferase family 2 protein n=1 Tax=Yersinia alsatica TaxID=2890317 RepID=UPI0032EB4D61
MDNKKILSLIIPVYNADKYLELCLNSVFSQWDNNLEVIIINDGSTDNSPAIIEKYGEKYEFIYIDQKNTGISSARNKGVSISSGEYITFLDSDDLWCDGIYSSIKKIVLDYSPSCIVFNYSEIVDDKEKVFELAKESDFFSDRLDYIKIKIAKSEMFYVWRFLFKKEIFNNISFDIGRRFEDQLLLPILINNCSSIFESNNLIVKYRQVSSSITKNLTILDLDDSEFGLKRFADKYIECRSKYWAIILASVFLSHVSKCARVYHLDKCIALKSLNESYKIVPFSPIIHAGKLKPILYYIFKRKLFFRLVSSVEHEMRK